MLLKSMYASGIDYEGTKDLGNTKKGDGVLFKGHGAIQTTGRLNHAKAGTDILDLPFLKDSHIKLFENYRILKNPKLLQDPVWGTLSAFIYWNDKDLNLFCQPDNAKVT